MDPRRKGFLRPVEKPLPPSGLSEGWISVYPHLQHPNLPYYAHFFPLVACALSLPVSIFQEKAHKPHYHLQTDSKTTKLLVLGSILPPALSLRFSLKSAEMVLHYYKSSILTSSLLAPLVAVSPA